MTARQGMFIKQWNALGVDLRGKTTGQIKTICPHCSQDRKKTHEPCLSVEIDSGMYYCHHCGTSGNINQYEKMINQKKTYMKPSPKEAGELSQKAITYFESRGISREIVQKMQITEGREYMPQPRAERNTLQFPYYEAGELVNIKYRDAEKNFKLVKDARLTWYNIDQAGDSVVIVEGEMDALSFMEAGIDSVISVPNGASNWDFFDPAFFEDRQVVLAVDNDSPGRQLQKELIRRIGSERCRTVDFQDCKDANEFLMKHGPKALKEIADFAKVLPVEGIIYIDDIYNELWDLYQNGLPPGQKIRHEELNKFITWEVGRLCIVTGIPSHGKSEFVDEICENLNLMYGWRVAYFSPENWPIKLHCDKLMAKITGTWSTNLSKDSWLDAMVYMRENFFWIQPNNEDYSLDNILAKAKILVKRHGLRILVIDPWNYLEHQLGTMTETQQTSKLLTRLCLFARQNEIMIILVAHPRKMEKNQVSEGHNLFEVPNLYSISGSAHFFNKADYGLCVYRNQDNDDVTIYVQKVKFRHLGGTGHVKMRNNHANGRYQEIPVNGEIEWDVTNHLLA